MVTLADRQYTLDDFEKLTLNCDIHISVDIQKKIDYLTSKVGAPTYSKTPNFKKGPDIPALPISSSANDIFTISKIRVDINRIFFILSQPPFPTSLRRNQV